MFRKQRATEDLAVSPSFEPRATLQRTVATVVSSYLAAIAGVGLAALLAGRLDERLNTLNISLIFLFVVLVAATRLGYGPAIVASVLSVLSFYLEYYPPYGINSDLQVEDWLTLGFFLAFAIATSRLASSVRARAEEALYRQRELLILQRLSESLRVGGDQSTMLAAVARQVRMAFHSASCMVLLRDDQGIERECAANRDINALQTSTLSIPLDTGAVCLGRLLLGLGADRPPLSDDELRLLKTFAVQAALAIEVTNLAVEARTAAVLREADKLKTALLRTISHDLRTPLATIKARTSSLLVGDVELDHAEWQDSMRAIDIEADRLSGLVQEILDMSRIEAGALQPRLELYAADDVVSATLPHLETAAHEHTLALDVPADLPPVPLDIALIGRVLSNLLENAFKYSPAGTVVTLSAESWEGGLLFEVRDEGAGIPAPLRERVFDAFYRVEGPLELRTFGAGLGLSICRGIVAAHNGWIRMVDAPRGGTIAQFWLPGEHAPAPQPQTDHAPAKSQTPALAESLR
jgi:two-component system sensor histidine kinase KdpD